MNAHSSNYKRGSSNGTGFNGEQINPAAKTNNFGASLYFKSNWTIHHYRDNMLNNTSYRLGIVIALIIIERLAGKHC